MLVLFGIAIAGGCLAVPSCFLSSGHGILAAAEDETVLYDNAVGLLGQKRYAEAEMEFRRAMRADPRYKEAWQGLADTLRAEGKIDQAAAAQRMADAAPAARQDPVPVGISAAS